MNIQEKPIFYQKLTEIMGAYGKPAPEAGMIKIWWELLESFPLPVVAAAFVQYRHRDSKFAPVPAAIEQICMCSDGRPEVEEAWTASLHAMDESETLVWTEEMQAAFWAAHPALQIGDEVAARMSFKQTYVRLIAEARANRKPVVWQITPGKNQERYKMIYLQAIKLGRLPMPKEGTNAHMLLAPPKKDPELLLEGPDKEDAEEKASKERARLFEELAKLRPASEKLAEIRAAKLLAEKLETDKQKSDIEKSIAEYAEKNNLEVDVKPKAVPTTRRRK